MDNRRQRSFHILYAVIIVLFICPLLSAKQIIRYTDQIVKLSDFYILESEREEKKYLDVDLPEAGFKRYEWKYLPQEKQVKNRMYTLRTMLYVDERLRGVEPALYFSPINYPCNLYLNGHLIYSYGKYKKAYQSIAYQFYCIDLHEYFLNYGDEPNEIGIELYPMFENSPLEIPVVSNRERITTMVFWRNFFSMYMVLASIVVALVIGFYFLFLSFLQNFREPKNYIFSFQCFFYTLSYSNISFKSEFINEVMLEKISRTSFPLTVLFLTLFFMQFTGILNSKKIFKTIMVIICTGAALVVPFLKTKQDISNYFDIIMNFLLAPLLLYSLVILIISLAKYKKSGVLFLIIGFSVLWIASIADIIYVLTAVTPFCWTVPYGYLFLLLCIFFVLALEQTKMHEESVERATQLNLKNKSLNNLMEKIKLVSMNLINSSKKLEEAVTEAFTIIEDNNVKNKQMMNKVINEFEQVEQTITSLGKKIDVTKERIPSALDNQTMNVEKVMSTISSIDHQIETTLETVIATNTVSNELSQAADISSKLIGKSKGAIDKMSEFSTFINEVLNSIEQITIKTDILAINASIESANAGESGKGFSIIAREVRNLSRQSKESLSSSFERINQMQDIITEATTTSDNVIDMLLNMIGKSKESADKINEITELVKKQKEYSADITHSIKNLLNETRTIQELAQDDQANNENVKSSLFEIKSSFELINTLLKEQDEKGKLLYKTVEQIKEELAHNLSNVDILNESIT